MSNHRTNTNMSELIGATSSTTASTNNNNDDSLLHSTLLNNTATAATAVASSTSGSTALGYCHVCNKQNRINLDSYTCIQCNGGFIEMFDLNDTNEQRTGDIFTLDSNDTNSSRTTSTLNTNNSSSSSSPTNGSFIFINSSRSNSNETNLLNPPLFQLIRRLNRSSRTTLSNDNTDNTSQIGNNSNSSTSSGSSLLSETASNPRVEPSRFGSSIHYRLRRHTNSNNANSNNSNINNSTYSNSNSSSSSLSSSVYSSMSSRHRHRYHRSPSSRFHFNILDNEDLLNDHGAIIITTLINQLRNTNRGAAPASETQIDSLPLIDIDQMLVEKITQCAICMEEFILNETAKQLPCKHLYHDPCIAQWLKLHATCPVCRTNINGTNQSDEDNTNERTNLFNIFPIGASSSLVSAATMAAAASNRLNESNTNRDSTDHQQQQQQQQNRRSLLRNPHVYRIQIRQALNPAAASQTTTTNSSTNNNNTESEYSLRPLRSRRITSPASSANTNLASSINTVPCSVVVPRLSPSTILNATSSQNTNRTDETRNSAFSSLNERNTSQRVQSSSTSGGSRVAHLMDRLFRHNRMSNRSSVVQNRDSTTSGNNNTTNALSSSSSTSSSSPSTSSFRFSQLFRSRHLRRNSSNNNDSSVSSAATQPSSLSNTNAAASITNRDSDFFELFRLESFDETRLRNRTRENQTEQDNRLFAFDLLDNNNNDETTRLQANLLGDLFDIPEHNIPLRRSLRERRRSARNSSNTNHESITITIDEDDSQTDSNINRNINSTNIIPTLIDDSDEANESSSYETSSSNETNLIGTIDLVSEENSSHSSHSISSSSTLTSSSSSSSSSSSNSNNTTCSNSSNLPHVAKKRKTDST